MNIFLLLELPEGVPILTYTDDIVIYCVDRNNIIMQLQTALNTMVTAASTHGFLFSPEKSTATWFYSANLDTKLQLYNRDIDWLDRAMYLGVNIDKKLNMHSHVEHTLNSVSRSRNTLKVVSSLSGVNSKILLRTFNVCTRTCLDNGAETFNLLSLTHTATTKTETLDLNLYSGSTNRRQPRTFTMSCKSFPWPIVLKYSKPT